MTQLVRLMLLTERYMIEYFRQAAVAAVRTQRALEDEKKDILCKVPKATSQIAKTRRPDNLMMDTHSSWSYAPPQTTKYQTILPWN